MNAKNGFEVHVPTVEVISEFLFLTEGFVLSQWCLRILLMDIYVLYYMEDKGTILGKLVENTG